MVLKDHLFHLMKLSKTVFVLLFFFSLLGCKSEPAVNTDKETTTIPALDSLILHEISADNIPGAVLQIKKGDSLLHRAAYGHAHKYSYNLEPLDDPEPMTLFHLFDLASLTKVAGTTFGIMLLVDRGEISLDDPVRYYLPEFEEGDKSEITIRHLLTHSAGLAQWVPTYYYAENAEERYRYIANLPLKWEVGEARHYSDLGFMLLTEIIERVSGRSLDIFLKEFLFDPLKLQHTVFNPLDRGFEKIAATSHGNPFERQMVYDDNFGYMVDADPLSWDGWREYTLKGEVNDGNAWYAGGGIAGHAGLFSTAVDLQVLVDLIMNKGLFEDNQLISAAVIDSFLTKDRYGNALGWAMDPGFISAEDAPEGTFGHPGFTGTSILVVPQQELSIILLTNRQNAGRQENGYYYNLGPLRQSILDEVLNH